jgi:multidrug transporter EmrE-like cation transporter
MVRTPWYTLYKFLHHFQKIYNDIFLIFFILISFVLLAHSVYTKNKISKFLSSVVKPFPFFAFVTH